MIDPHAVPSEPNRIYDLVTRERFSGAVSTARPEDLSFGRPVQLPTYTTAERNALTGLSAGAMIYNRTTNAVNLWNGSVWLVLANV